MRHLYSILCKFCLTFDKVTCSGYSTEHVSCEYSEMIKVLDKLIDLLDPQPVSTFSFECKSEDLGFRALFGGQLLAQSLAAAIKTLPNNQDDEYQPHSLHAYFLLPGNVTDVITYQVEVLRDGRSFVMRQVKAIQSEKVIFTLICSFQLPESGFEHQSEMPQVKGPDGIPSQLELARMFKEMLPEKHRETYTADKPIEMRVIDPVSIFAPDKRQPIKYVWVKAAGALPDSLGLHEILLAYASDFNLLTTSLYPHGKSYAQKDIRMASLDHALWFHRSFRLDEWLLYAIDSPNAGGARGFCRGQFFNQEGELVASVVQEGLVRQV